MLVREIVQLKGASVYTATPSQTLLDAIAHMADLDAGSLIVMDDGRMVGVLTFREVLRALKNAGTAATDLRVADVMVKDPVTAFPDMEANDLRRLMIEKHSRYLPVVEGDTLLGVISFLDVAKAVLEEQSFENKMLKNYIKNWPEEGAPHGG